MKRPLILLVFLAVLGLAAAAAAALSDFAIKHQIPLAGTPGRLAVTLDDRFVLILDQTNQAIAVLDTWDFSLKPDHIDLSAAPVSIALNPSGSKAYVTLDNGKVAVVDISTLSGLGFDQALSALSPAPSVGDSITISTTALGDIATVPWGGSATDSCVFVINGDTVNWFQETDPTTTLTNFGIPCLAREVEGGKKFAFVLCDASPNALLQQIECTSTGPVDRTVLPPPLLGTNGNIQSLSLAPNYDWLVVGDTLTKTLTLIGADSVTAGTTIIAGSTSTQTLGMRDILATDFASDSPVAFTVSGDTLSLAQIDAPIDQFSGNYSSLTLPKTGGGFLARSTPSDQYVYLSLAGGDTMAVVTANPWVEIISVTDASTVSTGNTVSKNVKFQSDVGGTYYLYLGNSFPPSAAVKSGSILANTPVTVLISNITNGQSVITVEVTDAGGRTGRNAAAVSANLGPVPQNFSLDFGTAKLIITFTVQDRTDLKQQDIYYGTTCDGSTLDYASITGGAGTPGSPIQINSPTAGQKISKVVDGVQNETVYCVQIFTLDTSGRSSVSVRKSILVEKVFTLTQSAGEEGGFNCLGALTPGIGIRESGAWLAAAPWLMVWLVRMQRRWRRSS